MLTRSLDQRIPPLCGLPLSRGISGATAALRRPVRVPNVHLDPRYVQCASEVPILSEMAVPILFKDRLLGVIDLESTRYDAFTPRHEETIGALASWLAVALENARLYSSLVMKDRILEGDLTAAREIQRGLLPASLPRMEGLEVAVAYEPARALGGDFYDFLPYDADRLGIVIGDVAGKSTAAALLAALTVGTIREYVVSHRCSPSELLRDLNDHLQRFRVDGRFVALAFALYDRGTRTLTLANAGFPRPHLLRGGEVQEVGVNGVPLALLAGMSYDQMELSLEPGDLIVFASDGIEECAGKAGDHFGVERLRPLLGTVAGRTPEEVASAIIQATHEHAADPGNPSDDRTVIVIRA